MLCIVLLMPTKSSTEPCNCYCFYIQVRFIVMGNMFRTELQIHRRYDLKGSTAGRTVGEHVDKVGDVC